MSLILKGSPSGTVYAQASDVDVSSSTELAVCIMVSPSAAVATPFIVAADSPLDGVPRGYYLRQDSPTLMTLGWTTANGNNEHQFTVTSSENYYLVSHFDISSGTVAHYVNTATPAVTHSSVGAAIDSSTFNVRLTTSSTTGEDVTVGDLGIWTDGGPDSSFLQAMENGEYLGGVYRDSGCTDKYFLVGDKGSTAATVLFLNIFRDNEYLTLERDATGGDAKCTTGDYLPAIQDILSTQVSSPKTTYYDATDAVLNQAKVASVQWYREAGRFGIEELIEEGYYDRFLGRFTSMPPRENGVTGPIVTFLIRGGRNTYPEYHDGVMVAEWDGTGTMTPYSSSSNLNIISPNRIEFEGGLYMRIDDIPPGGYIENIKVYKKDYESILASGRQFRPEAIEYFSRYDVLRMMDSSGVNTGAFSGWDELPTVADFWLHTMPFAIQIQYAMECGNEIWLNIPAYLGADLTDVNTSSNVEWQAIGEAQFPNLDHAKITYFFTKLVELLNTSKFPLTSNIRIEVGNEFWNGAGGIGRGSNYAAGVSLALLNLENATNSSGGSLSTYHAGPGFLSAWFLDEFQKALAAGGRESQVWTPIMGLQTVSPGKAELYLDGAEYFLRTRPSVFDITRYVPATTSYTYAPTDYAVDNDVLGQTYGTREEYYAALEAAIIADEDATRQLFYKKNIDDLRDIYLDDIPNIRAKFAEFGINNPIQEYEGSSHNVAYNSEWEDNTVLRDFLRNYNRGELGAAIQRLCIESFAIVQPLGAISNYNIVGNSGPDNDAWYEAYTWADVDTAPAAVVWSEYIDAPKDPVVTWSNYQATLASFEVIGLEEDTIRSENNALSMTTADTIRTSGSIFNSTSFGSINFEGAEFFYKSVNDGATYSPILANGNFTGFFEITGKANTTATTYLHDVVNDEWYEIVTASQGATLGFTVNNVLNATPSSSVNLEGVIYGGSDITVTGTNLTFTNNDSDYTSSIQIISGVTKYRRTVTANANEDSVDTFTITINDGTTDYVGSVDVVTEVGSALNFTNATETFSFAENSLGQIATFTANGASSPVYTLTGADASRFTINGSTAAISPAETLSYESPVDANGDGDFEFNVVCTDGGDSVSVAVTATITDVAEHVFAYAGVVDQTDVVPGEEVVVTSSLTGGVAGEEFSVSGMESSNDNGSTYNTTDKAYVVGQTFIRFTSTAPGTYSATDTVNGIISWSDDTDSVNVSYDVVTKAPLVAIDLGADASVDHLEGVVSVALSNTPVAGDGPVTFSITGGADQTAFVINVNTGVLSWVTPPSFDAGVSPDNEYVVEITASNDDGFTTSSDVKVITINVTNNSVEATDLPDLNITAQAMSDGSWTTNPNPGMSVIGTPSGSGNRNIRSYHDVIKFVKRPKTKVLTVTNITSVTNGVANIEFTGKYISATPSGASDMAINVTITDDDSNTISFNYNITDN